MSNRKNKKLQKQLSIRFDFSIYEELKKVAEREGRSIGGQARIYITKGLDSERSQEQA